MSAEMKSEVTDRDMVKSWAKSPLLLRMRLEAFSPLWLRFQDWNGEWPVPLLPYPLKQDSTGSDVIGCRTHEFAVVRANLENTD